MNQKASNNSSKKKEAIREQAEASLEFFIRLVHPHRVLGHIHEEIIGWWCRQEAKSHQLVLLPRDHGKSALAAYRVAWEVTKNPAIRVLYISSTANLAVKQLKFIKDILTSELYTFYWPEMINKDEGKREKWTETEISVDHPIRKAETIRDPTIFTGGLTTGITGMHCDVAVLDDVVVKENAYTEDGRGRVTAQYSLLSSIEGAEAREWVVGTRYHPKDLYFELNQMVVEEFDQDGDHTKSENLYEVFERQVESRGDGSGQFLWPRQQRYDGKWFGFSQAILAKKKAQYLDKVQFRAQYYNDPNDFENAGIGREDFQYYEPSHLVRKNGKWTYKGNRLNLFAAIDFAFSLNKKADYTAVVVVGVDDNYNYYVLDIERFKSNKIGDYFAKILSLHTKWDFRKLRAEVSVAQAVIVNDLKNNYIRPYGLALSIDDHRPNRHQGNKEERMKATLEPKYNNQQIWHFRGGNCQLLEEELMLTHPPHDDIKDCLTSAIDVAIAPAGDRGSGHPSLLQDSGLRTHSRFGGIY
tara:strand:- start:5765 stop:7342 length:1578 start_codon:yes stop_codon:yes gene_type:complete